MAHEEQNDPVAQSSTSKSPTTSTADLSEINTSLFIFFKRETIYLELEIAEIGGAAVFYFPKIFLGFLIAFYCLVCLLATISPPSLPWIFSIPVLRKFFQTFVFIFKLR